MKDEYYTVKEVAELLGVSTQTVNKLRKDRHIDYSKVGRQVRIPKVEIDKLAGKIY
jgi:excisionase family DNA binding protein